jgi:hypothetical protein
MVRVREGSAGIIPRDGNVNNVAWTGGYSKKEVKLCWN